MYVIAAATVDLNAARKEQRFSSRDTAVSKNLSSELMNDLR
jgi:hypothetical protein